LDALGALLAIPVAAAIQIVLRDWWSARKGIDHDVGPADGAPGRAVPAEAGELAGKL
jgi:hypothetical protein